MKKVNPCYVVNIVLASSILSLAACNGSDNQTASNDPEAANKQESEVEVSDVPTPMNLNGQIEFAKKDLAERKGVAINSVRVHKAEAVTWRSGALGCPESGKMYTEALVPGSAIYLQLDNMVYAYHATFAGEPFYCPRERVESPAVEEGVDVT